LVTVARRRLTDELRSISASKRREIDLAHRRPADATLTPSPGDEAPAEGDDTLTLLFLCCHPTLSAPSQLALTLRAVGGLTTAEIASAFLVPEATMGQRISRAKQRIREAGSRFVMPIGDERRERLAVVLHALYLLFNEGYTTSAGGELVRADLTIEAIRLTRAVRRALPDDGEVQGLLALMLLNDARRPARTAADGSLIPLAEQERTLWDRAAIEEGVVLITDALARTKVGPYQVQAAIAALHAEAPSSEETDWRQIIGLYEVLARLAPNPMVTLNHAVAVAVVHGPRAGLDLLAPLDADERMAKHHRLAAVRAHLYELAGDNTAAREHYRLAARRTPRRHEQRYLHARAPRLVT
jgi:predicted RNA polymerase sigma factor